MANQLEKTSKDDFNEVYEKLQDVLQGMNAISCIKAMAAQIGHLLALGVAAGYMQYEDKENILKLVPLFIKEEFEFMMRPENRKDIH